MSRPSILGLVLLAGAALAQQPGQYTPEVHPRLPTQQCTRLHGCRAMNTSVVLDSNYRWLHNVGGYDSCSPQSDAVHCPNVTACAANCGKCLSPDLHEESLSNLSEPLAIEGVDNYTASGITVKGNSVTFQLFTSPTNAASPYALALLPIAEP
jgi:hypothetical protein